MEVTLPITDGMKITKKGVNHREGRRSLKCCESIGTLPDLRVPNMPSSGQAYKHGHD